MKNTDIFVKNAELYHLPITTRVPLKFGPETLTSVVCARVRVTVENRLGAVGEGWGEVPLSVQWVWPSSVTYDERLACMAEFLAIVGKTVAGSLGSGHAFELGCELIGRLPGLLEAYNGEKRQGKEPLPLLAGLLCCSPFDLALHDAYGSLCGCPVYKTYNADFMNADLGAAFPREAALPGVAAFSREAAHPREAALPREAAHPWEAAHPGVAAFSGLYPGDFLAQDPPTALPVWHLVGGKDLVDASELTGGEPDDGYPVLLTDWIRRDGLKCLKIKLRGDDPEWDYGRIVRVGQIAYEMGALWLSADFNCTVTDPGYVNEILDKLLRDNPRLYAMLLYVEQPFPYDLESNRIDVRSVAARKPLFMDESAHHWQNVKLGRSLGWSGVALKTCKTQTGALLTLCWAKAHGMALMVQDLTNPMLAQIPHVLLAAHAGTIMGVESNGMQFYPQASDLEEAVHPGLYRRRGGLLDARTAQGAGFGMRVGEIGRSLPPPVAVWDRA